MSISMTLVGGGGSTGTHLLASILHNMHDIRVAPEIHITHHAAFYEDARFRRSLFRSLIGDNERIITRTASGAKYELLPSRVLDNKPAYGIEPDNLFDLFEESGCFADFVRAIKRRAAAKYAWPADFRWFEHSPRNSICIKQFLTRFPEERFVHLVRDGRDAMTSQAQRFRNKAFPGLPLQEALHISVDLWILLQNGALQAESHPGYLRIRYEDLVREPVATTNRVLTHLGYPPVSEGEFERARAQAGPELGFTKQDGWRNDLRGPINTSSIGRWQAELAAGDLAFLAQARRAFPMYPKTLGFQELQRYFGYE